VKYRIQALLAVGLLVGFYVVALAIVVALVYVGYLLSVTWGRGLAGGFWILAVVVAIALGRPLFSEQKATAPDGGGLVLREADQPKLWHEVRELAGFAATRPPDEIQLVAAANAGVAEETSLLGLVGGTRKMFIGAPLLVGLSREQLRAVLAHELGHYSGRHTALGALTYRGKEAIGQVLTELDDSFVRIPLRLYARLYLVVSQTVNRRQEFEADRLSAELVGSATAAEALRQTTALGPAWAFFVEQYVTPGADVGRRPQDLFDGFRRFLADPERQDQLAKVRTNLEEPPRSIYDSHPPITKRLAAFDAIAAKGAQDTSGPATTLLSHPQADLAGLGEVVYQESGLMPAAFEELVALASRSETAHNARVFLSAVGEQGISSPTLGGAVTAMKEGRSEALLGLVGDSGDDPDAARVVVARLLCHTVAHSLIEEGSARYVLDWGGPPRLVDERDEPLDPWPPAYEAFAADDDGVAAFETWLDQHGVHRYIEFPPVEREAEQPPAEPTQWFGVLAPVSTGNFKRRTVLGVTDSGILICKPRSEDHWAASFALQSFRDDGRVYTKRMLDRQPAEVLAEGRARHFRWAEITSLVARNGRFSRRAQLTASDGSTVTLRWNFTAHSEGQIWAFVTHYLGDRFTVEPRNDFDVPAKLYSGRKSTRRGLLEYSLGRGSRSSERGNGER
jgi:Zn-dependent protease with chaperone function